MPVQIDTAAAAARPVARDVADWAGEQRVFISSVMGTLAAERAAVAAAVDRLGAEPVWKVAGRWTYLYRAIDQHG